MMKNLIYLLVGVVIVLVGFWIMDFNKTDKSNDKLSMEVSLALKSALVGEARLGTDGGMVKEEIVANLVDSVVNSYNKGSYDGKLARVNDNTIKIDYVFLDKNLNVTDVDAEIDSVQFKISVYDEAYAMTDGEKPVSTTENRMSLNYKDGRENIDERELGYMRKVTFPLSDVSSQTKTITLTNLDQIKNVKVDNGNVSYTVNGDSVTLNVSGGTKKEQYTSGYVIPEAEKDIEGVSHPDVEYTDENIKPEDFPLTMEYEDESGFKGTLNRYVEVGKESEESVQKIANYVPKETDIVIKKPDKNGLGGIIEYVDEKNGVTGTLTSTGEVLNKEDEKTKQIKGWDYQQYADDEGYTGTLSVDDSLTEYTKSEDYKQEIINYPKAQYPVTLTEMEDFIELYGEFRIEAQRHSAETYVENWYEENFIKNGYIAYEEDLDLNRLSEQAQEQILGGGSEEGLDLYGESLTLQADGTISDVVMYETPSTWNVNEKGFDVDHKIIASKNGLEYKGVVSVLQSGSSWKTDGSLYEGWSSDLPGHNYYYKAPNVSQCGTAANAITTRTSSCTAEGQTVEKETEYLLYYEAYDEDGWVDDYDYYWVDSYADYVSERNWLRNYYDDVYVTYIDEYDYTTVTPTYQDYNLHAKYEGFMKHEQVVYGGSIEREGEQVPIYKYSGTVTKKAVEDISVSYAGDLYKMTKDSRIYKYKGTVKRDEVDTREKEEGYMYNVEIEYDVKPSTR